MTDPTDLKSSDLGHAASGAIEGIDPREITRDLEQRVPSIKNIPERDRIRAVEVVVQEVAMFAGPLPPPTMLRGYEGVLPGLADRITAMAESQLTHRHQIDISLLKSEQ